VDSGHEVNFFFTHAPQRSCLVMESGAFPVIVLLLPPPPQHGSLRIPRIILDQKQHLLKESTIRAIFPAIDLFSMVHNITSVPLMILPRISSDHR
jgi:hypothetical protein